MTINDPDVNAGCLRIRGLSRRLELLMREGREKELFLALADIEFAANKVQYKLNDLRFEIGPRR